MELTNLKQQISDVMFKIRGIVADYEQRYPKAASIARKGITVAKWGGITGFALILLLVIIVRLGFYRPIPSYADMKKIKNPIASEVYAADGALLGRYYLENRTNASIRVIPKYVVGALVATEDVRFYKHGGVDFRSLLRVFVKTFIGQDSSSGGGSTISQQLAKNVYGRKSMRYIGTPLNKIWEMIVARRLEKTYSKDEILELYLNTVSFGEDVYGIETASERYFNTKTENLRIQDGAVLIGMLKATTTYNPRTSPEKATERRNTVFVQMEKYDYLNESMLDSLKNLKLEVDYNYVSANTGLAPHFREQLRIDLEEICNQLRQADGSKYDIYTDGLKIYTTIDSKMQRYAEEAVQEHMKSLQKTFSEHWKGSNPWGSGDESIRDAMKETNRYKVLNEQGWSDDKIEEHFKKKINMHLFTYEGEEEKLISPWDSIIYYHKFLNTGFLAMNPKNGYLQAYVGSVSFRHFPYDHIYSKRQVGSIFKPIVYAKSLENGHTPCDLIPNQRMSYEDTEGTWSPDNADGKYGGYYSIKGGLTNSVNTIAVQLMMENGVWEVEDLARKMGVTSELPHVPSIALGTADISLYEMVKVYGTFANKGRPIEPIYLLKIEDRHGNVLRSYEKPLLKSSVFSKTTADYMIDMMQSVVENGTAQRLKYRYGVSGGVAGKTGTTQDQADGWFMGFTPSIVAGAWVGGYNRKIRFRSTSLGQGANTALPIWGLFMNKVQKDASLKTVRQAYFSSLPDSLATNCPLYIDSLGATGLVETEYDLLQEDEIQDLMILEKKNPIELTEKEVERLQQIKKEQERRRNKSERKENWDDRKEKLQEVKTKMKEALQKRKEEDEGQ